MINRVFSSTGKMLTALLDDLQKILGVGAKELSRKILDMTSLSVAMLIDSCSLVVGL